MSWTSIVNPFTSNILQTEKGQNPAGYWWGGKKRLMEERYRLTTLYFFNHHFLAWIFSNENRKNLPLSINRCTICKIVISKVLVGQFYGLSICFGFFNGNLFKQLYSRLVVFYGSTLVGLCVCVCVCYVLAEIPIIGWVQTKPSKIVL